MQSPNKYITKQSPKIEPCIHNTLIFNKHTKELNEGKKVFSTNR